MLLRNTEAMSAATAALVVAGGCVYEKKVYVHTLAAALVQSEVLHPVAFL